MLFDIVLMEERSCFSTEHENLKSHYCDSTERLNDKYRGDFAIGILTSQKYKTSQDENPEVLYLFQMPTFFSPTCLETRTLNQCSINILLAIAL